jgi:hypothetical protein
MLAQTQLACADVLPENRHDISAYMRYKRIGFVEDLLSGLRGVQKYGKIRWANHPVFSRFKDYITEKEKRIETLLHGLQYEIDDSNTLYIITGSSRIEKVKI